MEPTTVTRQELYRRVWEKPGSQLAREFGVSDVALAKVCRKHDIPRPPRGWWAKKQYGKRVRQPPLPHPDQDVRICIGRFADATLRDRRRTQGAPPIEPIPVRDRLVGLHPLVRETKQYLEDCDQVDRWNLPRRVHLDLSTSERGRRRGLLIMDALVRALEERGWKVVVVPNGYSGWYTCAVVGNVTVDFGLDEVTRTEYGTPVTKMELSIGHYRDGARRTWRDARTQRVEELLPHFVVAIEAAAAYMREKIELEKAEKRQVDAERTRRAKAVAEYRLEASRVSELRSKARDWDEAERIRRYIATVQSKAEGVGPVAAGSETAEWLAWARRQADRIDPLVPSPESVLDSPPPSNWEREDRGVYFYSRWARHLFDPGAEK